MGSQGNLWGSGLRFCGALLLLFVGLKLGRVIDWPWVWVLVPLWVLVAIVTLFCVIILVIVVVLTILEEQQKRVKR